MGRGHAAGAGIFAVRHSAGLFGSSAKEHPTGEAWGPPKPNSVFACHGACQGVGVELGRGLDHGGRAAVTRVWGFFLLLFLCSMLLHDDWGRALVAELATQPRPWENGTWMECGRPDLQGRDGSDVSQWRCPLTYMQEQMLLFEMDQLLCPLISGVGRQEGPT